jgi:hypothetical protein
LCYRLHIGSEYCGIANPSNMARDSESTDSDAGPKQETWKRHVWDSLDKSPKERKFLLKLDLMLLTFGSLGMSAI